jgi:DNA-binding beta-propeller fold protein YncE
MRTTRRSFVKMAGLGVGASMMAPYHQALAAAGRMVVISNGGDSDAGISASMTLIDAETLDVLVTLPAPGSLAFPAARWNYARDIIWGGTREKVVGYSLTTGEEVATIPTESTQNYTELTPDGRFLINAARFTDKLYKIDVNPDTPNMSRIVEIADHYSGSNPCDMTISADGKYAFTPDRLGGTVSVFSIDPFELVATLPLEQLGDDPLEPFMGTVSPRGDKLLVENARGDGSESVIDVSNPLSPVEIARFGQSDGLGVNPLTSEISPDGRWGVVICRKANALSIIDMDQVAITGSVALEDGSTPLGGTFIPTGERLFVPLPGRDAVAVVSVPDFEVEAMIPVGPRPLGAAYVEAEVPERQAMNIPMGAALENGRVFPANCPDRCCGVV